MSRRRKHDEHLAMDRREFIVAAGAIAVAYAPVAAAVEIVTAPAAADGAAALLDDWTIDDMWGVYPRPHEAIGYGGPRDDGVLLAALDPIDAGLLA